MRCGRARTPASVAIASGQTSLPARRLSRQVRVLALAVGIGALLAAGAGGAADERTTEPAARSAVPARALERAITPRRLRAHLTALEAIANRSGGNRAAGLPGYSRSVTYVTRQLRGAGYRPR